MFPEQQRTTVLREKWVRWWGGMGSEKEQVVRWGWPSHCQQSQEANTGLWAEVQENETYYLGFLGKKQLEAKTKIMLP
jgi:hypothetical protein